jgi:hypothetical protein
MTHLQVTHYASLGEPQLHLAYGALQVSEQQKNNFYNAMEGNL